MACKRCGESGHNSQTCKRPPDPEEAEQIEYRVSKKLTGSRKMTQAEVWERLNMLHPGFEKMVKEGRPAAQIAKYFGLTPGTVQRLLLQVAAAPAAHELVTRRAVAPEEIKVVAANSDEDAARLLNITLTRVKAIRTVLRLRQSKESTP